jgi:hypothetical protein
VNYYEKENFMQKTITPNKQEQMLLKQKIAERFCK